MTKNRLSSKSTKQLKILEKFVKTQGLPIARGIEKEGIRVTPNYKISQTDHPVPLGHPLTHPLITTDYSEALLELITPVEQTRESLLSTLEETHRYVAKNLDGEAMWAASMPCQLSGEESIRLAEYGDSNIGQLKYVYRQGLGVRYGRVMQTIAGLHFNFSLSDTFWAQYQTSLNKTDQSLQDFKSESYFAMIRNFRRYSWLTMYLFGASPAVDKSFLEGLSLNSDTSENSHTLEKFDNKGSYYRPYATSLRMGDLGYHNNAQDSLSICFNTLENFTTTLGYAIHTPYPAYQKIGLKKGEQYIQLNTNILQIENEYYSSIRPKRTIASGETPRHALSTRGVEYIEVRCLDINPFLPIGVSKQQVDFMDIFLLYCLLKEAPFIPDNECQCLDENFDLVVNDGRKPDLLLQKNGDKITLKDWATELLNDMQNVAEILDQAHTEKGDAQNDHRYQAALDAQRDKVNQPELTPSAQVLTIMKQESLSWLEFAGALSQKHKEKLSETSSSEAKLIQTFSLAAKKSFIDAYEIKKSDTLNFDTFMKEYQSEQ